MTLLKFKGLNTYGKAQFSTHGVDNQGKSEKKLTGLYKKLSKFAHNPVWRSPQHGTYIVTCRDVGKVRLIENALYDVSFDIKIVDNQYANVNLKSHKLISQPAVVNMAWPDSDVEDSEDEEKCAMQLNDSSATDSS